MNTNMHESHEWLAKFREPAITGNYFVSHLTEY